MENMYIYLYDYMCKQPSKKGENMLTTTLSDFRKDMKSYFDKVTMNSDTLIINRGKDTGVVIISLDEYNALKATQHELSSKLNEQRLDAAIEKLRSGKSFSKEINNE
jgi:antitoxin YefM